jgi:hypothetical protein
MHLLLGDRKISHYVINYIHTQLMFRSLHRRFKILFDNFMCNMSMYKTADVWGRKLPHPHEHTTAVQNCLHLYIRRVSLLREQYELYIICIFYLDV